MIIIFIFGCSKNEDSDLNRNPNAFVEIQELESAVDTIYVHLARATKFNSYYVSAWGGDDITTSAFSSKADYRIADQRYETFQNARAEFAWRDSYSIIKKINTLIYNAQTLETSNTEEKDRMLGEVLFIRGFLYHHLIRMFGKIPIQIEHEFDFDQHLSDPKEVYEQIEHDWQTAIEQLPDLYPGVEKGAPKPNKGTVRAFLSRLYLDWGGFPVKDESKYNLAASYAKQVIDNHTNHGFDLVLDLDDLWTIEHRFNTESIFTIEHCKSCIQGGNYKTGKLGLPNDVAGWAETFGEIKFFESFPENHRKQATYITELTIEDNNSGSPINSTLHWTNFIQPNPILAKITGKGDIPYDQFVTDRNDYTMRYAEVLLTYAEASSRSGNVSPEAWEALNMVRRRAEFLPPYEINIAVDITTGNLAELAYTERGWELAGEYHRWFDLIRMERVSYFLDNTYRNDITSTVTDVEHPNYGLQVQEMVQIIGSTGVDNYYMPFPMNYKELYPQN